MLERGISPRYFQNLDQTTKHLLAVHNAKSLNEIPPESITHQGGRRKLENEEIMNNIDLIKKNQAQLNKICIDD